MAIAYQNKSLKYCGGGECLFENLLLILISANFNLIQSSILAITKYNFFYSHSEIFILLSHS